MPTFALGGEMSFSSGCLPCDSSYDESFMYSFEELTIFFSYGYVYHQAPAYSQTSPL